MRRCILRCSLHLFDKARSSTSFHLVLLYSPNVTASCFDRIPLGASRNSLTIDAEPSTRLYHVADMKGREGKAHGTTTQRNGTSSKKKHSSKAQRAARGKAQPSENKGPKWAKRRKAEREAQQSAIESSQKPQQENETAETGRNQDPNRAQPG